MLVAKNRKALYDYAIDETFIAGIVLKGHEVKAVREGKINFEGSFVQILNNKPVVVNMHIGKYSKQSQDVDDNQMRRTRGLLLNKKEIEKLQKDLAEKGKTAVPLALILKNNLVKLEFGIAKGRKKIDKRQLEKERQIKRDTQVSIKENTRL